MSLSSSFLVKILQLELKEVENDLNGLKDLVLNRHTSSDITHYVFLENTALIQSELESINHLGILLDKLEVDSGLSPHEVLDVVEKFMNDEIKSKQYSEAIYNYVKTKLAKVSKYLDM